MLRKLLDSPWLYFGLAAVLALAGVLASVMDLSLPTRPKGGIEELRALRARDDVNVVFILIDTLRADRLGAYGYERDTSPTLDFLAESGVRFANVEAQSSWTKSSMASLWTGAYPRRTGVLRYPDAMSPDALMPAEILQQAGFRTAGIYRNGWVDTNFGFQQGFDLYVHPKVSATPARFERHNPSARPLAGTDLEVTQSALEFLRSHGNERFFLYLHYMDVHQYLADDESAIFGEGFQDYYDNAIRWTDRNVSGVLGQLADMDLFERTLVVIVSDHGESFLEHGSEGHARTLYREVTETPWLMFLPFRLEAPAVVDAPVRNVDVWPTVLDLLGLPPLPGADGRSQVAAIEAAILGGPEPPDGDRSSFAELDRNWGKTHLEPAPIIALVDGPWRFVHYEARPDRPELFDRRSDPEEQVNVADEHPERVARYREAVDAYLASPRLHDAPQVEIDDMRLGQLKALGYMVEE